MEPSLAEQMIDRLGGNCGLAKIVNRTQGAVRMMRLRKRVPRDVWPEIMLARPDISLEDLLATEAPQDEAAA